VCLLKFKPDVLSLISSVTESASAIALLPPSLTLPVEFADHAPATVSAALLTLSAMLAMLDSI